MSYMESDTGGLYITGEAFDYLWSTRGYSLLLEDFMRMNYLPMKKGYWVDVCDIKPEDLGEKIEDDIRHLIEEGVLKEVPFSV